jgi:hypothetical protein
LALLAVALSSVFHFFQKGQDYLSPQ